MTLHRPACPKCLARMTLARVVAGPIGFEQQAFECRRCDYAENVVVAIDPMNPRALGWLAGEVGRPRCHSRHCKRRTDPATGGVAGPTFIPAR
jgi:hypothetical protein